MNALDASVASQSETSRRSEIRTSSEGFVSQHFDPFFDFITQFIHPHYIFYIIYIIILSIQIMYVSMWLHFTSFWIYINDDKITHSFSAFAKIIHYIAPLSPVFKTVDDYMIPFIVFTVIVLVLVFSIFFQLWFYKSQRRFSKVIVYPTRILIELVTPLMLVPFAHLVGHSFYEFTKKGTTDTQIYVFFVIGLIEYLILISIFFYSSSIIGVSAYISLSPIATFDQRPYVSLILSTSIFTIAETCFQIYSKWIIHPFIVFHIIFGVYIAYSLTYQPFVSYKWNCYFLILDIFAVLLDLLTLISYFFDFVEIFKDKENGNSTILMINLVVFFALLIVSIVIGVIYSYKRYHKIKNALLQSADYEEDKNSEENKKNIKISEDDKKEIFLSLKLDRSEPMALSVLYFVIQNHIVPYLDFVLIKFILSSHKSVEAIMQCMRSISYFPTNSRYLNMLFNAITKRRDTKFTHRFFIFQIQKIKMLRQSSSSLIACEKLNELNEQTKELEEEVIGFWQINPNSENKKRCKIVNDHGVDVTYLYKLQDRMNKTRSLWNEALADFPNSIPYRDEFCHFIIECQTDFANAIKNKHKSDLIESGKNFNVDMAFRLFVKTFPEYLKKGIIDVKGNFIRANQKQGGGKNSVSSNNSSKNSFNSTQSSTSMIDGQIEEEIGRSLITQSRIRLALQHSTRTKKASRLLPLIFVTGFLFLLGIIFALFIFIYFKGFFDTRARSMARIEMVNKVQLYTYSSALMILYKWGNLTNQIKIDDFVKGLEQKDKVFDPPFLSYNTYGDNIVNFNVEARDTFGEFLIDVSELSAEGVNVFKYGETLFADTTPLHFCNESHLFDAYNTNLKTALLFIFMSQSQIANLENITLINDMFKSNVDYCHILTNLKNIYPSFQLTRELLIEMNENDSKKDEKSIYNIKLALSIVYAVITVLLSCTFFFLYIREIMFFVELLLKLPKDAKLNAMKPIRKYSNDNNTDDHHQVAADNESLELAVGMHHNEPDKKGKFSVPLVFCVIIFFCFMGNIVLTYFQLENVQSYNQKYFYLGNWDLNSRFRKVLIIRLTDWVMHYILAENHMINGSFFVNKSDFPDLIDRNFDELNDCTNKLLQGQDGIPSSNGEDSQIDELTYQEVCTINESDTSTPLAWGENHSPGEKCLGKCNHLKKNFGGKPQNPHSLTL